MNDLKVFWMLFSAPCRHVDWCRDVAAYCESVNYPIRRLQWVGRCAIAATAAVGIGLNLVMLAGIVGWVPWQVIVPLWLATCWINWLLWRK